MHRQRFLGEQRGQSARGQFSTETRGLTGPQGCEIVRSSCLRLRTQRCQSGAGGRKGGRVLGHWTEFSGDPIDHRARGTASENVRDRRLVVPRVLQGVPI